MAKLNAIPTVEPLRRLTELGEQILKGQVRGRVVIDVNGSRLCRAGDR